MSLATVLILASYSLRNTDSCAFHTGSSVSLQVFLDCCFDLALQLIWVVHHYDGLSRLQWLLLALLLTESAPTDFVSTRGLPIVILVFAFVVVMVPPMRVLMACLRVDVQVVWVEGATNIFGPRFILRRFLLNLELRGSGMRLWLLTIEAIVT